MSEASHAAPVLYLTGAPGTGKTTTARLLQSQTGMRVFSYGSELSRRLRDRVANQAELRRQSSTVISATLVAEMDGALVQVAHEAASTGQGLIVDSHAVTKEAYGFRCIPYTPTRLQALEYTHLVCLYASATEVAQRIQRQPEGRRLPSQSELEMHNELQRALVLVYAHTSGVPSYFVDAAGGPEDVVQRVRRACTL